MITSEPPHGASAAASELGAVVAGHPREAETGAAILEAGGNAFDAVVAAAFVGFVVEPSACGLGGSGHLALFVGERDEFVSIAHNVRAPQAARGDMFELDPSEPPNYYGATAVVGRANETGHRAVAVPGAVAGLCEAHEHFGTLPLAHLLEPAIAAAEEGVPVTPSLVLDIARRFEDIRTLPAAADVLLPGGTLPKTGDAIRLGDRLDFRDLAGTLKEIASRGSAGFYTGRVAAAIEREVSGNGGLLTAADLRTYRPKMVVEVGGRYRDLRYATVLDPVGYETLNILERFDLSACGSESPEYRHLMAEAMAHALADNTSYYGDPDFVDAPVAELSGRSYAAIRAEAIRLDRAAPRPVAPGEPRPSGPGEAGPPVARPTARGGHSTSHMAVADRHGNLAALCTTLTTWFGSLVLVPGTGILLNNTMQDFDPRPYRPNGIEPGKMPMFAVPTVVAAKGNEGVLAISGAGGYRITTGVLHTLVNMVDFGMAVDAAVTAPRVYSQGDETYVDRRITQAIRDRLAELGHEVVPQAQEPGLLCFARIGAVAREPDGTIRAAGSPSWATAAVAAE